MRAADPAAAARAFVTAGRAPDDPAVADRMPLVKICGVVDADGIQAALRAGADAIGLNVVPGTPRELRLDEAAVLARLARSSAPATARPRIVAISADRDAARLREIVAAIDPDVVQLNADVSPTFAVELGPATWKVLHLPSSAVLFTPEFKRNVRQLAKKYRRIKSDVQPLLDELGQGQTPGDQIPGVQYEVFKVRVRNSDSGKGKSGGYRVIYQRTTDGTIILITIYSKTEQEDIAPNEVRQIILDYESQQQTTDEANKDAPPSDQAAQSNTTTEPKAESDSDHTPSS